jgi:poly(A) polymerase
VSRERIGNELRRMLSHPTRARAVELMESMGLAGPALGEAGDPSPDLSRLSALPPGAPFEEALAAWMLGRGAGGAHAPSCAGDRPHAEASPARCRRWREALVLSNDESAALEASLSLRPRLIAEWAAADVARRKRLAAAPGFAAARALLRAEGHPLAEAIEVDLAPLAAEGIAPPPFVTGDDLTALGLRPGPRFRTLLDAAYDRQLGGAVRTRAEALDALRREAEAPETR